MPAEVLYRKWRPQRFADVAGQDFVRRTLLNALAGDRVSHAYLFSGPRGTGKTTMARLLSKAINCEQNTSGGERDGEPCNMCPSCVAFGTGSSLDLIEMDGASNRGIDDIKAVRENAGYLPMGGAESHKVYLIDEVHMLTEPAFNALLKTLEEPPPHVIFILATTDAHKVPATIVSRCQRYDFKRIGVSAIVERLSHIASEEGFDIPREGLEMIARSATGSLRDAINLLEQICDSFGPAPSVEAVREGLGLIADERAAQLALQALRGDFGAGLATIGAVRDDGLDLRQFQKEVVMRLRELLLVQSGAETEGQWTAEQLDEMRGSVEAIPRERLVQALRTFGQADLRADPLSPLPLELALADALMPPAAATAAAPTPEARPSGRPAAPRTEARRPASPPPPPRPPARQAAPTIQPSPVPEELRRDLSRASAEDIARMLGSDAPVIPPAGEGEAAPANGVDTSAPTQMAGGIDLVGFVDQQLRPLARKRERKLDALLNGSCRALSWEDGVLTLGFYQDTFHKKSAEEPANKRAYEELASEIIGQPVTIRCIISPRPPRPATTSPLVQHAVETHGAEIVAEEQES